ncbi:hypothetical protein HYX16_00660 [Candidatus Woesearchaeota archaeon]|nr:hypothetical protein [Candidatus Woesearchaeota archaeon]
MKNAKEVPNSLKIWFLIHFVIDYLFAIPLTFFPNSFLKILGWTIVDNLSARLVGAALIGIGGISLLENKSSLDIYNSLLTLKILWSLAAIIGITISISEGTAPKIIWSILIIFIMFSILWIYYKIKLKQKI